MKTLYLFRHGKSDWEDYDGDDHERPISKRGEKAARTMGKLLALAGRVPDSIVTSSAVRARTTVEIAARAGGWRTPVRTTRALYEAAPEAVLGEVRAEPDGTETLLLAGHEPTWSELASLLIGGGNVAMPTGAVAAIELEIDAWKAVAGGKGRLLWLLVPKFFSEGSFDLGGK
jgi:phosphohistidine phosphatase